jgi:hypothetical protein
MNDSDTTKHYLYMQDRMGLDCSAFAVTHQFERKHYMRYSQPFQPCAGHPLVNVSLGWFHSFITHLLQIRLPGCGTQSRCDS